MSSQMVKLQGESLMRKKSSTKTKLNKTSRKTHKHNQTHIQTIQNQYLDRMINEWMKNKINDTPSKYKWLYFVGKRKQIHTHFCVQY